MLSRKLDEELSRMNKIVDAIAPAKREQFADWKSGCRIEESQRALPDEQLAEKELMFCQFEYLRCSLPYRALAHELDRLESLPRRPDRTERRGITQSTRA